jgi:magnesium transporter
MTSPVENFQERLIPVRKNLLELECYYDQMGDVLKELKENENEYFEKEKLRYFRTLSERAERLERKTAKLLEQSKQLRDVYQAQMEVRQNQIMQFLTIVSTIFAPLTLLTGWYGMNFAHMPELAWGYPFVGGVAVFIIIVCILFFKRKKML